MTWRSPEHKQGGPEKQQVKTTAALFSALIVREVSDTLQSQTFQTTLSAGSFAPSNFLAVAREPAIEHMHAHAHSGSIDIDSRSRARDRSRSRLI